MNFNFNIGKIIPPWRKENVGEKLKILGPEEAATKIQASWRGKKCRRSLRLQAISALIVQRYLRGFFQRQAFKKEIASFRAKRQLEKEQSARLKHIKSKETDLQLLNSIKAEQYLKFEELRKTHHAKRIQRSWREYYDRKHETQPSAQPYIYGKQSKYSHNANKYAKLRTQSNHYRKTKSHQLAMSTENITSKDGQMNGNDGNNPDTIAKKALHKKKQTLHKYIHDAYQHQVQQDRLHPFQLKPVPELEENALGLSQLYQRVREDMVKRQKAAQSDPNNPTPALNPSDSGGIRHKYQELMHLQEKMQVLLGEYLENREFLDQDKLHRQKQIQTCQRLMTDLLHLPAMNEEIVRTIQAVSATDGGDHPRNEELERWLYDDIFVEDILASSPSSSSSSKPMQLHLDGIDRQDIWQKAFQEHYATLDMLQNQHRWDAVFLPAGKPVPFPDLQPNPDKKEGPGEGKGEGEGRDDGVGIPSLAAMQKNYGLKSLKSLTADIATYGITSEDDSLYWLEYAHQPSRLLSTLQPLPKHMELGLPLPNYNRQFCDIPTAETLATVQPIKRKTKQQTKVYQEVYNMLLCNPHQRIVSLQHALHQEEEQIAKLSYWLQEDLYDQLYHKVTANYATYLAEQEKARKAKELFYLTKAQSLVRGFLARRKYQQMLRQQRIYSAFQHLLFEINHPRNLPGQTGAKKQQAAGRYPSYHAPHFPSYLGEGGEAASSVKPSKPSTKEAPMMSTDDVFFLAKGLQALTATPQPPSTARSSSTHPPQTTTKVYHPGTPAAQRYSGHGLGKPTLSSHTPIVPTPAATTATANPLQNSVTHSMLAALTPLPINKVEPSHLQYPSGMMTPQVNPLPGTTSATGAAAPFTSAFSVNNTPRMTEYADERDGLTTPILQLPSRQPAQFPHPPTGASSSRPSYPTEAMSTARSAMSTERSSGGSYHSNLNPSMITISTPTVPTNHSTSYQQRAPSSVPLLPIQPSHHTPMVPTPGKVLMEHRDEDEDEEEDDDGDHHDHQRTTGTLPHDTSSLLLSPFMEMLPQGRARQQGEYGGQYNEEDGDGDGDGGYISSPSHGYSLSRSLSASFGQVVFQPPPKASPAPASATRASRTAAVKTLLDDDEEEEEEEDERDRRPSSRAPSSSRKAISQQPLLTKPYQSSQPSAAHTQSLQDHSHLLFLEIDARYQKGQCESARIVESALVTDIRHFQKPVAYAVLTRLIQQHGPYVLIDWLRHYYFPLPPSTVASPYTPSLRKPPPGSAAAATAGASLHPTSSSSNLLPSPRLEELPVEQITTLLSEAYIGSRKKSHSSGGTTPASTQATASLLTPDTIASIIQLSFFFRLLGAVHSTGNVRLLDVHMILEDLWFQSLSADYQLAIHTLQKVRALIVKKATRQRCSVHDYLLETLDRHGLPIQEIVQLQPEAIMRWLLILYQPIANEDQAKSPYVFTEALREKLTHVTYFVIESMKLEKEFHTIGNVLEHIMMMFGSQLPSYRALQIKLQTWFRALPQSYTQLLNELPTLLLPTAQATPSKKSDFLVTMQLFMQYIRYESILPLTFSEARLFGDILTRAQPRLDAEYSDEEEEASDQHDAQVRDVDIKLLYRLKNNELIEVAID